MAVDLSITMFFSCGNKNDLANMANKLGIPLEDFINNLDQINGRWLLINSFKNIGQGLVTTIKSIASAWRDIFPAMQSEQLFNIIAGFHKFTTYLKVNETAAENLRRTFKGVFAALDVALTVIGGPLKLVFKVLTQLLGAFHLNVLDVTANISDAIVGFRDWVDSVLDFSSVFEKISPYISEFIENVKEVIQNLKQSESVEKFVKSFNKLVDAFKKILTLDVSELDFRNLIEQIKEFFASAPENMKEIGRNIVEGLQNGISDELYSVIEKSEL